MTSIKYRKIKSPDIKFYAVADIITHPQMIDLILSGISIPTISQIEKGKIDSVVITYDDLKGYCGDPKRHPSGIMPKDVLCHDFLVAVFDVINNSNPGLPVTEIHFKE